VVNGLRSSMAFNERNVENVSLNLRVSCILKH